MNRDIARRVSDRYRQLLVDTFVVDTKIIDLILTPDSEVLLTMETNTINTQVTARNYYRMEVVQKC